MFLVSLWIVVVYLMWLKGRLDLAQRHGDEVPARFRAVLDLATALSRELLDAGEVSERLTNRQLEHRIKNRLDGGRVAVRVPSTAAGYSLRKSAWSWMKTEKWWCALAFVSVSVPAMTPILSLLAALFAPFAASVLPALAVGRTMGSRVVMSLCGLTISLLLFAGFASSAICRREFCWWAF
jgi:hypothetical protein